MSSLSALTNYWKNIHPSIKEGGIDLFGRLFTRKNMIREGWKSSELHDAIHKLSQTIINNKDVQNEKNEVTHSQQKATKDRRAARAPPRPPMPMPSHHLGQKRPLPPIGRGAWVYILPNSQRKIKSFELKKAENMKHLDLWGSIRNLN